MLMKKTKDGTICANTFEGNAEGDSATGIAFGIYSRDNACSLEYDESVNAFVLWINDTVIAKNNIQIKHTDSWIDI